MIYQIRYPSDTDWQEIAEDSVNLAIQEFCSMENITESLSLEVKLDKEDSFQIYEVEFEMSIRPVGSRIKEKK